MMLLGLDPGLRNTGWGVIETDANRLRHVANGVVRPGDGPLADRLLRLHEGLTQVIGEFQLDGAAVEETFVNRDGKATLKLGQARGIVMLVPAQAGLAGQAFQVVAPVPVNFEVQGKRLTPVGGAAGGRGKLRSHLAPVA